MTPHLLDWVLFLQEDARYLYAEAARYRERAGPADDWISGKVQENAAYGAAAARALVLGVEHCGRTFTVLATYPESKAGTNAANAYMTEHDGACLLCIQGGILYLAHRNDRGTPTKDYNV